MTKTDVDTKDDGAGRILDSLQDAEHSALEAVRKFLDTVNGVFPDMGPNDGPRKKIIDSAFEMTERLVGSWDQFAKSVVKAGQGAMRESEEKKQASKG